MKLPEVVMLKQMSPQAVESLSEQFHKPRAVERRARLDRIPRDRPMTSWKPVERLDVPTLVVGADHDPLHPLDMAAAWARHLSRGQLVTIASKYGSPEQHIARFRRHLAPFLESVIP